MDKSKIKQFSIKNITLFQGDDDVDFAFGEVYLLAGGNNSHKNPIDLDILKRDAHTMLGKFLTAEYSKWTKDVTSHTNDQVIIGYFPKDGKIEFKEKDGKVFAVYEVLVSKLYATQVYELFKQHNFRSVSAEFSAVEGDEDEDGNVPILGINFHGCTILGLDYKPSCEGAEMSIKKFSANEADEYYQTHKQSDLKKFSEERRKKMATTYKVNKTELKDTPWGDVDKTALRNKVMEASNRASLVKDVYALVEAGWENSPSEHLKYPIMQLVGDTFYYNRGALASALGYAKKENETEVIKKVESLYRKFNLEDGEEMAEKKFGELEGRPLYAEVIKRIHSKLGNHFFVDSIEDKKVVVTNEQTKEKFDIPAKITLGKDDEDMSIDINYDGMRKSEVQKAFEDEDKKELEDKEEKEQEEMKEDEKDGKEKKMSDDEPKEKEDEDKEEKEMSLDMNAYNGAILELLRAETAEQRAEARKLWSTDDPEANIVMDKLEKMCTEMAELKAFKDTELEKQKDFEVDKILASVKDDLKKEDYEELEAKKKDVTFDTLEQFKLEAKSFAYDHGIKKQTKKDDGIIRMGYDFSKYSNASPDENVWDRINKK